MDILVIGGTEFVGRHLVERALYLGHKITLFHRGKHGTDLFPGVERILGDRDGGLDVLGDRKWDAVIDTCGYVPRVVRQSVEKLANQVDRYLFISTISVLGDPAEESPDEKSPLASLKDPNVEEITAETYGGLKVLCEQEVEAKFGARAIQVRPGIIVGPYDKTDRFTHWFLRAGRGGKMLSLAERDERAQFIDGRDLANFCFHLLDTDQTGTYMTVGPNYDMTWGDVFDEAALLSGSSYEIVRPALDWLESHGVQRGTDFPAQIPSELNRSGFYQINVSKAIEAGLKFRPLSEIVKDTIDWWKTSGEPLKVGLSPEREQELLAAYHEL